MNEITDVIKTITPGVVGAASGVVYTRGHWLKRIANILVFNNRLRAVFYCQKNREAAMPQGKIMRIRDYVNQIPDAAAISTAQTTTVSSAAVGFLSWVGSINWVGLISVLVAVAGLIANVYFSYRKHKREEELHQFELKIKGACDE